jgi:acryloyl-coenzyme A reductase
MRAVVLRGYGPAEALHVEDWPEPIPSKGNVIVEIRACGVSYRDILARNGTYRRDMQFPAILGLEIAGVVRSVGEDVPDLRPGDHVCTKAFASCGHCRLCRSGRETTCSQRQPVRGGYAEVVALPWDAVVKMPVTIPFEVGCTLGPAAGVALNAVRDVGRVTIGDSVLITGATGGVGFPAVQLARLAGGRVIAVTRSHDKMPVLREYGASEVIVSAPGVSYAAQVREITQGQGVDVVLDTVGSRVFDDNFDSLGVHGRYLFVGQLFGEDIQINPARIFFKRAQLLGVGSVSRAQLEDTIALAAAETLTTRIARVLPLTQAAEAHRLVEQGLLFGRVVLVNAVEFGDSV